MAQLISNLRAEIVIRLARCMHVQPFHLLRSVMISAYKDHQCTRAVNENRRTNPPTFVQKYGIILFIMSNVVQARAFEQVHTFVPIRVWEIQLGPAEVELYNHGEVELLCSKAELRTTPRAEDIRQRYRLFTLRRKRTKPSPQIVTVDVRPK